MPPRTLCAGTRCTRHATPRVLARNAPTLRCTRHTPCRTSCAGTRCTRDAAPRVLARDAHATPHLVCWHAMPRRCDAHVTRHAALRVLACNATLHLMCWHAMPLRTLCAGMRGHAELCPLLDPASLMSLW